MTINKWIKAKILGWLGLATASEQINQLETRNEQLKALIKEINQTLSKRIKQTDIQIVATNSRIDGINQSVANKLMEYECTLKATVNVGVDFNPARASMIDRSWAVVCIQGKIQDIV